MAHKLLLADDSVTIQRVIELTFADEDVQVIAVGDGKQAIERVRTDRPDIVLADVGMPERDGYEVAAFVKGNPEFAHVPVLLLTGAFEPIDESRARSVGCDGVLVKPFEPQMVINRVKDLLAGKRPSGLWAAAPSAHSSPQRPAATSTGGDFDMRDVIPPPPPTPVQPASSGALEDYFDRLDAAFSKPDSVAAGQPAAQAPIQPVEYRPAPPSPAPPQSARPQAAPSQPAAVSGSGDALSNWDPELSGDPSRPVHAASEPPRPAPIPVPRFEPVDAPAGTPRGGMPPTAEALDQGALAAMPAAPTPGGVSLADAFAALLSAEQGRAIEPSAFRPGSVPDDAIEEIVRRVIDRLGDETVRKTVLDVAERLVREEIARIKTHAR
jgi:CheY-like chemotaxis protein